MASKNLLWGIGGVCAYGLFTVYWNLTPNEELENLAVKYAMSDVQKKFLYDCDYVFKPSKISALRAYKSEKCACMTAELGKNDIRSESELAYINNFQGEKKNAYNIGATEKSAKKNNFSGQTQTKLQSAMIEAQQSCNVEL